MNKSWNNLLVVLAVAAGVWTSYLLLRAAFEFGGLEGQVEALESRVVALETENQNLEGELGSLRFEFHTFEEQVAGRELGTILIRTYDYPEMELVVGHSSSGFEVGAAFHVGIPMGNPGSIVLYDSNGKELDRFDLAGVVEPGDLVSGWVSFEAESPSGFPYSPDMWHTVAYYWNRQTGLAVSLMHFDGSADGAMIVR